MPISYSIDTARQQVFTIVTGRITVEEVLDHLEAAKRENFLSYVELIDARGVTPPFLSSVSIWQAAASVCTSGLPQMCGPRAIIVGSAVIYGMTRMFATLVSDYFPIVVFRYREQAGEWLENMSGSLKS